MQGGETIQHYLFSSANYDRQIDTINHNDYESDEFSADSYSLVNGKTIHAPMIQGAFVNIEYTLKEAQNLSSEGIASMIFGKVEHVSVEEEYAQSYEKRYGKNGFMDVDFRPLKT